MSAQDKKPFTREQQRKAKEYVAQRRDTANAAEKAVYAAALVAFRRLIHRRFMAKLSFSATLTAALKSPKPLNASAPECAKLAETARKILIAAVAGKREGAEKDTCEEMAEDEWEEAQEAAQEYTTKLAREAEITALWAILNGKTENEAVKEWKKAEKRSFPTAAIAKDIKEITRLGKRWGQHRRNTPKGAMTSAARGLAEMTSYLSSLVWMQFLYRTAGTETFYVMRGSSYPCNICQEQVGLHTDTESLPPYHKRCCCIAIPVTE